MSKVLERGRRRLLIFVGASTLLTGSLWTYDWIVYQLPLTTRFQILREFIVKPFRQQPRHFGRVVKSPELLAFEETLVKARHGEKEAFSTLIDGLKSPDPNERIRFVIALGKTKRKEAIGHIGPMLYDKAAPPRQGCVIYLPVSHAASEALGELMPYTSLWIQLKTKSRFMGPTRWIPWWEKNRLKYQRDA